MLQIGVTGKRERDTDYNKRYMEYWAENCHGIENHVSFLRIK
jgi:hypothetical protein